jgi:cell division protein ZapA (FtsZ GTPase activity inhibitor)
MRQRIPVTILGRSFTATAETDQDEVHLRALSAFVEQHMRASGADEVLSMAVLAALQIAHELHTVRRDFALLTSKIERLSQQLSHSVGECQETHSQNLNGGITTGSAVGVR